MTLPLLSGAFGFCKGLFRKKAEGKERLRRLARYPG
jgi:hypothetical protein